MQPREGSRGCPRAHSQSWCVTIDTPVLSPHPSLGTPFHTRELKVPTWGEEQGPGVEMTQDKQGEGGPGVPS